MISVIIPAFNAAPYLAEAIRSVLVQAYRPLEVLVVDDGSTDDTPVVARSFGSPVVCWSQVQAGVAAARNAGVERATGNFIAFLDADDVWAADKLARQHDALAADPSLDAAFGHVQPFFEASKTDPGLVGPVLLGHTPSTMLIRTDALRRIGPYNASLPLAESLDWFLRAQAAQLRYVVLADVVLHRRIHGQNASIRKRDEQTAEYFRVLRAELDRKRSQPKP